MLSSYTGDSKTFSFEGAVFDGYFEDIIFQDDLAFSLKILTLDDGIQVTITNLQTTILYENKTTPIAIAEFDRIWKLQKDPILDGDDIGQINTKNMTIDIAPVLREEIIMHFH